MDANYFIVTRTSQWLNSDRVYRHTDIYVAMESNGPKLCFNKLYTAMVLKIQQHDIASTQDFYQPSRFFGFFKWHKRIRHLDMTSKEFWEFEGKST